jgi:hypothetical protein
VAKSVEKRQVARDAQETGAPGIPQDAKNAYSELRRLEGKVVGRLGEQTRLVAKLLEEPPLTDPVRVRVFVTRCLLRIAQFIAVHETYWPLVKKILDAAVRACLRPSTDAGPDGQQYWSEIASALNQGPPLATPPAQLQACKGAVGAAALAAALADANPEHAERWVEVAAGVCGVIGDELATPAHADEELEQLSAALQHDYATLANLPTTVLAVSPWENGPLGELWPAGIPGWYQAVGLAELTSGSSRPSLESMPDRDARQATVEKRDTGYESTDPLAGTDEGAESLETLEVPGSIRARCPLALEQIRERMRHAVQASGQNLGGIGVLMGVEPDKHPRVVVWNLLNRTLEPGIFELVRFCKALGIPLSQIVPDDLDATK